MLLMPTWWCNTHDTLPTCLEQWLIPMIGSSVEHMESTVNFCSVLFSGYSCQYSARRLPPPDTVVYGAVLSKVSECRLQHVHSRPRRNSRHSNSHKTPSTVLLASSGRLNRVLQINLGPMDKDMVSRMALSLMQSGPPSTRATNDLVQRT